MWPVRWSSQTSPEGRTCTSGSSCSRRGRWRRPTAGTGWSLCDPVTGREFKMYESVFQWGFKEKCLSYFYKQMCKLKEKHICIVVEQKWDYQGKFSSLLGAIVLHKTSPLGPMDLLMRSIPTTWFSDTTFRQYIWLSAILTATRVKRLRRALKVAARMIKCEINRKERPANRSF